MQILAAAESCSTDVVYYLLLQTDNGSTDNNRMLNVQTDGGRLEDDGLTEDGTDNEGQTTGRMRNGQTVQSKNRLLVYRSIVT